jgi:hypothetical protein
MSRFRPAEGPAISLFPFLAVLLCTMGALLVLLVLFSRASSQPGETAEQQQAQAQEEADLALVRDSLAWRLEQVKTIKAKTADDLTKARLQLAGIEEHVRKLTDELNGLEGEAAALAASDSSMLVNDEELARLEERLKSARESLDEKRRDLESRPAKYAVIAYEGPSGTHRRPLYIECSIEGVYLQPEGIRLTPSDFEGPSGPGNPLASALRAAREHIANTTPGGGETAVQPYPLLLVRPSGVMAYYAARDAIQSWGSDFGYQLIDEDWTLDFPPRDPALAEVEKRAIAESRERLAWLMSRRSARPSRPTTQYRAATTRGGVVSNDGPSVLGDQSQWDWSRQQAARGITGGDGYGGGFGGGGGEGIGNGTGVGQGVGVATGAVAATGNAGGSVGGNAGSIAGDGDPQGGLGDRYGNSSQGPARPFGGAGSGSVYGDQGTGAGGMSGAGGIGGEIAGGQPGMRGGDPNGGAGGASGPDGSSAVAGQPSGGMGGMGGTGGTGGTTQGPAGSAAGGASNATAGGAGGGAGMGGPQLPGMLQPGGGAGGPGGSSPSAGMSPGSMAGARGKNWASLATADRPIPLTRPIHIECSYDELRVFDDSGRAVVNRIPLGPDTTESIDPLVKAVHRRVEGWGLAGDRMYWNPQLVLSETADGRSRREDIERLLADSGLETRRKGEEDAVRRLPPVYPASTRRRAR